MTAAPPHAIDRDAVDAAALARWAELCRVADERDRDMAWGLVLPLDEAGGDEPAAGVPPFALGLVGGVLGLLAGGLALIAGADGTAAAGLGLALVGCLGAGAARDRPGVGAALMMSAGAGYLLGMSDWFLLSVSVVK